MQHFAFRVSVRIALAVLGIVSAGKTSLSQTVFLDFVDDASGEGVPARVQWEVGEKRVTKPRTILSNGAWWLGNPRTSISPREGEFEFLAHRGPEFTDVRGGFTMQKKAMDIVLVEIPRSTDMHAENWYSSDLSVLVPLAEAKRWQRGDAIDVISVGETVVKSNAPPTAAAPQPAKRPRSKSADDDAPVESIDPDIVGLQLWAKQSDWNSEHGKVVIHSLVESEGAGGAEVAFEEKPQDAPKSFSELMERLNRLPESGSSLAELVEPWGRDTPILLSSGGIKAVRVLSGANRPRLDEPLFLNNAKTTQGLFAKIQRMRGKEKTYLSVYAPFSSEDRPLYKNLRGTGMLTEHVYWKLLECGLRLSATAGSEFGISDTHIGYNRTYFYHESQPTPQDCFNAISLGKTTTTNGPLLRTFINNLPPGSNQTSYGGSPISLEFGVSLTVREHVDYLDVIFNGKTLYSAKLEEHYKRGEFPPIQIEESGWLTVRVVTAHENGYRLASTSPFYFEVDRRQRISKQAVQFMQQWLENSKLAIAQTADKDEYAPWVEKAEAFWGQKMLDANAP